LCHLFDGEANRALLGRLRAALRPGGMVAVVDVLPSLDPDAQRSVSLYALGLLGRTSSGDVHTEDRYREWLADAGFVSTVVTQAVGHPPITLITAEAHEQPSEIG
jgi:O-methyltransferase